MILLVVVQLLINTSSGLALVRSSGVAHALMYLRVPVSAIRIFCVALLKYALILNIFHAGNLNTLFTGVSIV